MSERYVVLTPDEIEDTDYDDHDDEETHPGHEYNPWIDYGGEG